MKTIPHVPQAALAVLASTALLACSAHAGSRTSANYTIATETIDGGGRRSTSANFTNDGSVGLIAGVSSVAAPAETAKHGYNGQLYEVTGLLLSATPTTTVNEAGTLQLSAALLLDDATTLALPAASVTWSVASGFLKNIDANGVALAQLVYENSAATAQGNYAQYTSTLPLTVLNVNPDNYGPYQADGIDDAWQVQYFGQPPNALAGPNADPDGDGQSNLFEYVAGIVPTDPNSRFNLTIAPVPGQPTRKALSFTPVVAGRSYTITAKSPLTAPTWSAITASAPSDNGTTRTITDLNASGTPKFYHVEITKP